MSSSSSANNSNNGRHAYDQQIPTEQNIRSNTKNDTKARHGAWRKRDDEIVTNFPEAAAMGRILMNVGFPADKNKIIQFVKKNKNPIQDADLIARRYCPYFKK